MRELTAFDLAKVSPKRRLGLRPDPVGTESQPTAWAEPTELGRQLGMTEGFGVQKPVVPLFAAVDATTDETLATYPDGSAAVALRHTDDGWSLFVGPPGLTSELLRLAARKAGVHLFTNADCNVYANGPYILLHASQDGPVQVNTGNRSPIVDLLSGEPLGQGPTISLNMNLGETRLIHKRQTVAEE
jgi:hypothetical protein